MCIAHFIKYLPKFCVLRHSLQNIHSMFLLLLLEGLLLLLLLLLAHAMERWNTEKKKQFGFIFQGEVLFIVTSAACLCR